MRFIKIENCKAEMKVSRSIYGAYGVLMLNAGNTLRPRHVYALQKLGYPGIYIDDEVSAGIDLDEAVDDKMRKEAVGIVKEMFDKAPAAKSAKSDQMYSAAFAMVEDVVDCIFDRDGTVLNVPLMKSFDDYTYQHSVNVGILSVALGRAMNFKKSKVLDLGKAAFFHDMGKMFIPKAILNKTDKLTLEEFKIMKKHCALGLDFAKEALKQPSDICRAVLHHHEKFDGTGYPLGLSGKDIPMFSQIISISDVYDALVSSRAYKKAFSPAEGYEYIMANAGIHFDPDIVEVFTKTVAPFPVGTTVKLSNGLQAVIMRNNPSFMMRPLIRVFDIDKPGYYEYINLANDPKALNITIIDTV